MLDATDYTPRLETQYKDRIRAALREEFSYKNDMMIPRRHVHVLDLIGIEPIERDAAPRPVGARCPKRAGGQFLPHRVQRESAALAIAHWHLDRLPCTGTLTTGQSPVRAAIS